MSKVIDKRVTAAIEGDFVVFLIGMRINRLLEGAAVAARSSSRCRGCFVSSRAAPSPGSSEPICYVGSPRRPMVVQYWRSFEHLEAYARSKDAAHWPAWVAFNKRVGSSGDVGIWHETYLVPAGGYDSVYNNMPPIGLGAVSRLVPAAGRKATAAGRAGIREESYPEGAPTERIDI